MTTTRTIQRPAAVLLLVAAAIVLGGIRPGGAATPALIAATNNQFTPVAVTPEGDGALFVNLDAKLHTVTAVAKDPVTRKPLFDSGALGATEAAPIAGIESLEAGTYDFICVYHGEMVGTLVVVESLDEEGGED